MARNDPQVNFRIPVELKQRIEAAAAKNNRSFKAEIEIRLDNWEDVIDQLDLTHQGWEADRLRVEQLTNQIDALRVELGDANTRYENLEDRYAEYRHQGALEIAKAKSEALPASLTQRIKRRASQTGRSPKEEMVLALEAAFPPIDIAQSSAQLLNLEMVVLQWRGDAWRLIDWDNWSRFRSGETSTIQTPDSEGASCTFLVLVVDNEEGLTNIISHNYRVTQEGLRPAFLDHLTNAEADELNRLMKATAMSKDDEARLSELQAKTVPASLLPPESIPPLKEILGQLAPDDIVVDLLHERGLVA